MPANIVKQPHILFHSLIQQGVNMRKVVSGLTKGIAGVLILWSLTVSSAIADTQQDDESHLPPGFRSNISLDPALAIMFENLRGTKRDFSMHQIFKVLSGDESGNFHLKYNYDAQGRSIGGSIPPAMKCDGGYAFVNALWSANMSKHKSKRTPADTINSEKLSKESPSMEYLIYGMEDFLMENFTNAEPKLLGAIFINLFGRTQGIAKAKLYADNPDQRDAIINEANQQIAKMTFSQEEYRQCEPSSESTRLMLAQWGAWALTNNLVLVMENTGNRSRFEEIESINAIEKLIRNKSHKIRATEENEFYISRSKTDKFDY